MSIDASILRQKIHKAEASQTQSAWLDPEDPVFKFSDAKIAF